MPTRQESVFSLLAADPDAGFLTTLENKLQLEGVDVLTTDDAETVLGLVKHRRPRIILLGLTHSAVEGDGLLGRILERDPGAEIIVMSEADTAEAAVEALKQGASDYLCKPVALETLRERVEKLVAEFRRRQRALRLDVELLHEFSFEGMVGRSAVMLEVFNQLSRIAPHFQTVLVSGPTGTGKELVARALHGRSPAAPGPFVSCNCSAIVETLFESELFGHVKGAFTGATQDKIGLIEYANGGTLFMDEVGDLPMTMQAKLLRVMQNWEVQRVGSPVTRKVNIRLVAATNRDLRQMVAQKHFRDDLYHRLSMLEVRLPSLTERKEDLPLLIRHFIERFAKEHNKQVVGLARRAQVLLGRYSWPGNVRELENVLRHAFLMAPGDVIHVDDLPDRMREPVTTETGEEERAQTLDEVERAHARRVMELVHGNKLKAAKVLGVSRATLYRLLGEAKTEPKTQKS